VRFADKKATRSLEPEGRDTPSSMFQGVLHRPAGSAAAELLRYPSRCWSGCIHAAAAYAVDYDYPTRHPCGCPSLQPNWCRAVTAGTSMATTGYESAAPRIGAAHAARLDSPPAPVISPREGTYIGTLIDDLVRKIFRGALSLPPAVANYRWCASLIYTPPRVSALLVP